MWQVNCGFDRKVATAVAEQFSLIFKILIFNDDFQPPHCGKVSSQLR
jgi:hypothetical protein